MGLFKQKQTMLYYKRILFTIATLLVVILLIYSIVTYYSSEKTILQIQNDANMKVLSQVNYNIDYVYEMVQNLAYYLYYDNMISPLLYEKDDDLISSFDYINKIRQLNNITSTAPFVDSIILYNCYNKKFVSTGLDISLYNQPLIDELELHIQHKSPNNVEFSTINYMDQQGGIVNMFIFFLRDWSQLSDMDKSMVIISVKPDWLFTDIKTINKIGGNTESRLFLMDNNYKIYSSETGIYKENNVIDDSIKNFIVNSKDNSGFLESLTKGKKQLISYIKNDKSGWCIISEQPYDVLFSKINKLRITFILITLGILAIALSMSFYFSKRLYKPLREMSKHFRGEQDISGDNAGNNDELNYIMNVYDQTVQKLTTEKSKSKRNEYFVNQYLIKRLLADSQSVIETELEDSVNDNELKKILIGRVMILVLKVDNYVEFDANPGSDKNLYKFAIQNISEEILSRKFLSKVFDIKEDHLVFIINADCEPAHFKSKINDLVTELQKVIYEYYQLSLTAAYCEPAFKFNDITKIYNQILYIINYRLVLGKRSIITPDRVRAYENCKSTKLPDEFEKKLVQAIKSDDRKQIDMQVDSIFSFIGIMRYDNIMYSIHHLILLISQTVNEININHLNKVNVDMQSFNTKVKNCETLIEIKGLFKDLILKISEEQKDKPSDKNDILVDTICSIIEDNYQDINLSLQLIASTVKLSSTYVGKVFRSSKNMSVAEFINEVRLKHMLKLLEDEEYSVRRSFEAVGFTSQSYFFTLFKKKYGCTPKEYRFVKAIRMNMNDNADL